MTTLAQALKGKKIPEVNLQPRGPVWTGPNGEGPQGGVTQSLLSRFLVCRERFRLLIVEGIKPADSFSHRLEFGSCWHVCEEQLAKYGGNLQSQAVERALAEYGRQLCKRYPTQQGEIDKYYQLCKAMFPLYVKHWSKNKDQKDKTPLLAEQMFDVPYKLPSGRTVRLRGKWDGVNLVSKGRAAGIRLFETKTKGDIDEQQITSQLSFDLQTMMYLVALQTQMESEPMENELGKPALRAADGTALSDAPIAGVDYNVIRRPLSGGKGDVRLGKDESIAHLCERLQEKIREWMATPDAPDGWFYRWKVEISQEDIAKFKRQCLDPILEQLCDWWQVVNDDGNCKVWGGAKSLHFRLPYGVWNPLLEGRPSDMDYHLATGSMVGMQRVMNLFPELQ